MNDSAVAYRVEDARVVGEGPFRFPPVCVKCGDPAEAGKRSNTQLSWAPPWVVLLILFNACVMLIVYLATRKQVRVEYSQCPDCRGKQMRSAGFAAGGWILGVVFFVLGGTSENGVFFALGLVSIVIGIVAMVFAAAPIKISNYNNPYFELSGFHERFLASLDGSDYAKVAPRECGDCGEPLSVGATNCRVCGAPTGAMSDMR